MGWCVFEKFTPITHLLSDWALLMIVCALWGRGMQSDVCVGSVMA